VQQNLGTYGYGGEIRSTMRKQVTDHEDLDADKGKFIKCMLKASVDTVLCLTLYCAGLSNVLDTVI
jgi:hypothetical protein